MSIDICQLNSVNYTFCDICEKLVKKSHYMEHLDKISHKIIQTENRIRNLNFSIENDMSQVKYMELRKFLINDNMINKKKELDILNNELEEYKKQI